jgi:N-acetylmuramoyl-L-alanine amidase
MTTIALDAGHGGNDLGDDYGSRYEKNDNLRLTLAIGEELEADGYDVVYTRTNDTYVSQNDRVSIANESGADFLLSIHRIIGELIVSEAGLGFYTDTLGGIAEEAAVNIAEELRPLGFVNYSITIQTEYFRGTEMPFLILGIGHLNFDYDNLLFDTRLDEIAEAIATGIKETIPLDMEAEDDSINDEAKKLTSKEEKPLDLLYSVQVGMFSDYGYAVHMHNDLLNLGYPSQVVNKKSYYAVMVGADKNLDYIAELEFYLRQDGYSTLLVSM